MYVECRRIQNAWRLSKKMTKHKVASLDFLQDRKICNKAASNGNISANAKQGSALRMTSAANTSPSDISKCILLWKKFSSIKCPCNILALHKTERNLSRSWTAKSLNPSRDRWELIIPSWEHW
jgi:hypothetical protein